MLIFTVILMDLLTGMEFDLFVPSFPQLQSHFGLSPFWVELSLSLNFIGYCLSLFLVGELADRYGRKPVILLGLLIFTLGSLLCLSTSLYYVLLIGRFLQGLGIAAPAILSFVIIADLYPLKQQQFLLAMLNGSLNTAAAFAPVLGSYITHYFNWTGNFTVLLILGIAALIMAVFFVPTQEKISAHTAFSWQSYQAIFKAKTLVLVMSFFIVMCLPYWVFVGVSPLLYMQNLGVSLTHFGYYQGSLALIFALGSILFGFLMHRYEQRKALIVANQILFLSLISLLLITVVNSTNPLLITLAFIPFVIGQIIPSNLLYPICLQLMPTAKGRITALIQGGRLILTAITLQIVGHYYQGSARDFSLIISFFILLGIIMLYFIGKNRLLFPTTNKPGGNH